MICLFGLLVGVAPRSVLLELRLFCVGRAYNRLLGRVFRSAGSRVFGVDSSGVYFVALGIVCFSWFLRFLGRVFRSAGNRIICYRSLGRVFRSAGDRLVFFTVF